MELHIRRRRAAVALAAPPSSHQLYQQAQALSCKIVIGGRQ